MQFCTVFVTNLGKTLYIDIPELDTALRELRRPGFLVRPDNTKKDTWHIADGGLYGGYVGVTSLLLSGHDHESIAAGGQSFGVKGDQSHVT